MKDNTTTTTAAANTTTNANGPSIITVNEIEDPGSTTTTKNNAETQKTNTVDGSNNQIVSHNATENSVQTNSDSDVSNFQRRWKTKIKTSEQLLDVKIESKTRFETFPEIVPQDLYAPLVYQLQQEAVLRFSVQEVPVQFIIAKIKVKYADNPAIEVLKDKNPILSGTLELALTKKKQQPATDKHYQTLHYSGSAKVKFMDSSYNHQKRYFVLQIMYFFPHSLENPVFVKESAPFKVFARRKQEAKKPKQQNPCLEDALPMPRTEHVSGITTSDPHANVPNTNNDHTECNGDGATKEKKSNSHYCGTKRKRFDHERAELSAFAGVRFYKNDSFVIHGEENQHIWADHFDPSGQQDGFRSVLQRGSNNEVCVAEQNHHASPAKIQKTHANQALHETKKSNNITHLIIPTIVKQNENSAVSKHEEETNTAKQYHQDSLGSDDVNKFCSKLQELVQFGFRLDDASRCKMIELAVTEFFKLDPSFSCKLMFSNLQKMVMNGLEGNNDPENKPQPFLLAHHH